MTDPDIERKSRRNALTQGVAGTTAKCFVSGFSISTSYQSLITGVSFSVTPSSKNRLALSKVIPKRP